jgi:hypothetical protein
MLDEKIKTPQQQPDKGKVIEKGQQSGQLNESKIPDFKFTPPPPPPPPAKDNSSSGGSEAKGE